MWPASANIPEANTSMGLRIIHQIFINRNSISTVDVIRFAVCMTM